MYTFVNIFLKCKKNEFKNHIARQCRIRPVDRQVTYENR